MPDPFTLSTGDPEFDPQGPVMINGYRYVPTALPDEWQQKLYTWAFNVMLEESGLDGPMDMVVGGAVLDYRDLHQILTWAAGTIAGLIDARPGFEPAAVKHVSDRASIIAYLEAEAGRRKVPSLRRAIRVLADNLRAGMDHG